MVNLKDINVTINSYFFEAEINVPSPVLTSTPQNEELNLSYSPNFQMKVEDTYSYLTVSDTANVSFSYDGKDYTAYCNVINRSGNIVTLQYADGLVVDDTPVVHTLEFSNSTFSTSRDNYTDTTTQSSKVEVLYDGEPISVSSQILSGNDHCTFEPIQGHGGYFRAKSGLEVDVYSDTVTVTYEGLTATCTVTVTITDSTPAAEPYFSSPLDGSTITGTLDPDLGEFKYPIEVVGADGNNISYDVTAVSVTCDNQDVAVGYEEDADENEQSYISGVYLYIYQTGTDTATLTFDNGEQSCTTTFTYDISDNSSDDSSDEPTGKYLDVECSLSSNSKSMALPNDKNLQTFIYAAVYLVDPNTIVGEGTENEHYYTKVVISQSTYDNAQSMGETIEQLGWWGTKPYDDYLILNSVDDIVSLIDGNGDNLGTCTDEWGDNYKGIWRFDELAVTGLTIFNVHGARLYLTDEGPYDYIFDLATPYIRVMRNGSPDTSGTFYGTVNGNGETVWSDYLIYPVYDDMYGGTYNASSGSDFLGQYGNGGTFVGQYVSNDPHGYPFMDNLGAYGLDPSAFEGQDSQEVWIEWRRENPEAIPEYYEGAENEWPYYTLYYQIYNFSLQVPE